MFTLQTVLYILTFHSRPSSSVETIATQEQQEYLDAESFGRISLRTCEEEYPECTTSLMDIFSSFNNPFESLFKTYS